MKENPSLKIPPNSKEAEMMVLGCMLTSINSLNIAAGRIHDSDFYFTEHKIVFQVLKQAYANDKPVDVHIVCEELKRQGNLTAVGGAGYVTTLAQFAGTSAYIDHYVEIVSNKSLLRKMIHASQSIEKNAFEEPAEVHGALDDAQQLFFEIGRSTNTSAGIALHEILDGSRAKSKNPFLKELQDRQEKYLERGPEDPGITGIPTHFLDLDKMINGFNNSNLMILAGRPSMGKTALGLNFCENIAFRNKLPVGIFSLEMSAEQLAHRMVCSQSEVESEKIQTGSLNGSDYQRIVACVKEMQSHTIIIDDQPGLKITDLRARARRMKESHDIRFLMIDYLQLISGSGSSRSAESRQMEISEISRMLKNLARELDIPVLCLSQLSRKVEERVGHRPMLSDLRESGSIEQDSDQVLLLFRPEYYDLNNKPGVAEVNIAKNRHGGVGIVSFNYQKAIGKFRNYTPIKEIFHDN